MNTKLNATWIAALTVLPLAATPSPGPADAAEREDFLAVIFQSSPRLEGTSVEVEVRDDLVFLSGPVGDLDQAEFAVATAAAMDGIDAVVATMTVREAEIDSRDLADSLAKSGLIPAGRIEIAEQGGVVTLGGTVDLPEDRVIAREIISRVDGVKEIRNRLEVSFSGPLPSETIAERISLLVADDPLFDLLPITVSVSGSDIAFAGQVGSAEDKARLARLADGYPDHWVSVSGVVADPNLVMEGLSDKTTDTATARENLGSIYRAAGLEGADSVSIDFKAGALTLMGTLPSAEAHSAAVSLARGVPGVRDVYDRLTVAAVSFEISSYP